MSFKFIIFVVLFVEKTRVIYAWLFSCPRGTHNGRGPGDNCSVFCQCKSPFVCEAFRQRCSRLSNYNELCHLTKPCKTGLSCQPGVQRCYKVPRRLHEPCSFGFPCGPGLSCAPGFQLCFNHPRHEGEPCSAGYPCSHGLSCHPGLQRCYHVPRDENEPCSLGYGCSRGLSCTLCGRPLPTCQMSQVPALTEQDMEKRYNQVAFLVTHNSYSNGREFAVWARNQRFDIAKQLKDGVRGLMLDIYPGWNNADVRLCHASCFWNGSSNLLNALIDIRKFLDANPREIVTIIFEDHISNPSLLAKVFHDANISRYVLPTRYWGTANKEWPSLQKMTSLGHRLVVFNDVGLGEFPYCEHNMWNYVTENRYGSRSKNTKECFERNESEGNGHQRPLVLVNWFTTIPNPVNLCPNEFNKIMRKLETCRSKFGKWANFLAVDYYTRGRDGGAFKAVQWLNQNLSAERTTNNIVNLVGLLKKEIEEMYVRE